MACRRCCHTPQQTLFKAQLSTSRLRANLEEEYQVIINFVFKALYEVRMHDF